MLNEELADRLLSGQPINASDRQQLVDDILDDASRASAFGITPATVQNNLKVRLDLLPVVYPAISQFCQNHLPNGTQQLQLLWDLWLPLAIWLAQNRQMQSHPLIQGILGGQGTGKTTLGAILTLILQYLGYKALSLSLDDLYKTYTERSQLRQQDPRLIWRGPPGTHDVALGLATLEHLRHPVAEQTIPIPRFDKSLHQGAGDRVAPELVSGVDIVLFEGWFVGVRPIAAIAFDTAPPPITTETDRNFARDMNARLQNYLPLWERLDRLIVLLPGDYRYSKQWRKEAEQKLRATGKPGMSDAEIETFVDYFWKALHPELLINPLVNQPDRVDLVVEIDLNHIPGKVYSPSRCG